MNQTDLDRICQALPVFPLPRTVLMPGELLPLHVFEPRYRSLIQHCLDGDRVLGIATLQPGFEREYQGRPAIHPELGIGHLAKHQGLPDGRCNIVLESIGRARLMAECDPVHAFREVRGTVLKDDMSGSEGALQRLRVLVLQLGVVSADAASEASRLVDLDGAGMVDALARKLLRDPDDRRAYIGTDRLVDRVTVVESMLSRYVRIGGPAGEA